MYKAKEYHVPAQQKLVLENEDNGLTAVILPACGGMLVSLNMQGQEYLYSDVANLLSEERPKCGMPILFPICGRLKEDSYFESGEIRHMGIHGLAQYAVWEVMSAGESEENSYAKLRFCSDERTKKLYPYEFCVDLEYKLVGNSLYVFQTYHNQSEVTMRFSFGFHPYFCISELKSVEFQISADELWIPSKKLRIPAPGRFAFEIDGSSEYGAMFFNASQRVSLWDRGSGHRLEVSFSPEFPYHLLWSRPEDHFVCMEPWSAPADAFHTAPETLTSLEPGQKTTACIGLHILDSASENYEKKRRRGL